MAPRQLDPLPAMDPLAARVKVGKDVRAMRCRRRLKAGTVADTIGVSAAVYSAFEAGERPLPLHHVLTIIGALEAAPDLAASVMALAIQAASRSNEQARLALAGWRLCPARETAGICGAEDVVRRSRETIRAVLATFDAHLAGDDAKEAAERGAVQIAGHVAVPIARLVPFFSGSTRIERSDAARAWLRQLSPAAQRGVGTGCVVYSAAPLPIGMTAGDALRTVKSERRGRPVTRLSLAVFNYCVDALAACPSLSGNALHGRVAQAASQQRWERVPGRTVLAEFAERFRRDWLGYASTGDAV